MELIGFLVIIVGLFSAIVLFSFGIVYAYQRKNEWQKIMSVGLLFLAGTGSIILYFDEIKRSPPFMLPAVVFLYVLSGAFYWSFRLMKDRKKG
jgi:NADH:ubiquinone oxidoreductase subunit K